MGGGARLGVIDYFLNYKWKERMDNTEPKPQPPLGDESKLPEVGCRRASDTMSITWGSGGSGAVHPCSHMLRPVLSCSMCLQLGSCRGHGVYGDVFCPLL